METIKSILENHLLKETHKRQRAELKMRFPELIDCPGQHFLMLRKYIISSPQKFYLESSYLLFLSWLKERDCLGRNALQDYLTINSAELNRAFLHLDEINKYNWHDYFDKLDDYELIRFIDQQIHPTYLRLIEAVLIPFLRIVANFLRLDRNKSTEGLNAWSVIEEVNRSSLSELTQPYRHTVRNAIAHGAIIYLMKQVCYRDQKAEETYDDTDVIRNFDDLLDTCNAITFGLSIFLFSSQSKGYILPQQLLLDELREETKTPWWEITGCVPSEISGSKQLVIYARPRTTVFNKVRFSAFQSGVLAESFAPGYDWYFFSIRSEKYWQGWAKFNGKELRRLRLQPNVQLEEYRNAIEDIFYHVPGIKPPRFYSKFETFLFSFRLHLPYLIADIRKNFGWANIKVRQAKIHRNGWRSVLKGSVIIENSDPKAEINKDLVRKSCRRIIRDSLSYARTQHSRMAILRYLPLGFADISVFRKDYRRRRLSGFGLGKDLICTLKLRRIRCIRIIDIMGSTIE